MFINKRLVDVFSSITKFVEKFSFFVSFSAIWAICKGLRLSRKELSRNERAASVLFTVWAQIPLPWAITQPSLGPTVKKALRMIVLVVWACFYLCANIQVITLCKKFSTFYSM